MGILAALALVAPRAAVAGFVAVLAANLALGAAGVSDFTAVMVTVGLAAAVGGPLLSRLPLVPLSLAIVAAYLAALAVDGTWVSLSPLGPAQAGRFYGITNRVEALLLVPALVGASLPATFLPGAILAVVTVAGSSFGADGGGAVVLVVAYAVLAVGLFGWRRAVPAAAAVAGAAVLAIVIGPSTHVTSAGSGALSDRIRLSWDLLMDDWRFTAGAAASVIALAVLVWRGPRPASLARARRRGRRLADRQRRADGGRARRSRRVLHPLALRFAGMKRRSYGRDGGLTARMVTVTFLLGLLYVVFFIVLYQILNFGIGFAIVLAAGLGIFQWYTSDKIALMASGAKVVSPEEAPQLHEMIDRLCAMADLPKPRVAVIDTTSRTRSPPAAARSTRPSR